MSLEFILSICSKRLFILVYFLFPPLLNDAHQIILLGEETVLKVFFFLTSDMYFKSGVIRSAIFFLSDFFTYLGIVNFLLNLPERNDKLINLRNNKQVLQKKLE